jgi:peroxiredoxin Q/BCP
MKYILIFISLGLAFFVYKNSQTSKTIVVGAKAPPFNLPDSNQTLHSLSDFKGAWLVLYFYPKDDTPGCTKEACHFRDDSSALEKLGAKVVGISVDNSDSHEDFVKKYRLPFPLLSDIDGAVAERYGALTHLGVLKFAKRHTFIIDPNGLMAKVYRAVDANQHSQTVLNDLKQLSDQ